MPVLARCLSCVFFVIFASCAVDLTNDQHQVDFYKPQIQILQRLLQQECPDSAEKRQLVVDTAAIQLEALKIHYNELLERLALCRANQTTLPTTKAKPVTRPKVVVKVPPAKECLTATNLTEPWRSPRFRANYHPNTVHSDLSYYGCDFHKDLQWFRFKGRAGTSMLNKCSKRYTCGGRDTYWTDDPMPTQVNTPITINVYGSHRTTDDIDGNPDCKAHIKKVKVMRCSWDTKDDFIYKFIGYYYVTCGDTFCGSG